MVQSFQTGITAWGACGGNLGLAACPIGGSGNSATFFQNNYNACLSSLETPALNLAVGGYRLTFKHVQRSWSGDNNNLNAQISLNGGVSWTTMAVFDAAISTPVVQSLILNSFGPLTSNTKIRLQADNGWGYSIIIDDVAVSAITTNDLELKTVNLPTILPSGNTTIAGSIFNNGATTISAATINYQVDSGSTISQTISGLSIATGQSYNFSLNTPWNASVGPHSVVVSVSTTNFVETNLGNNSITKNVNVASNTVFKKPLLEKFTASTCGPCASFNNQSFNAFYTANNSEFALICYHQNFPGSGDPYYTAEAGARRAVYNVTGVPDLVINSVNVAPGFVPSSTQLSTKYAAAKTEQGFFVLNSTHTINGTTISGNVTMMPYLTGSYKLFVVVVEKQTLNNTGTNGETSFKHVMMKMVPDAAGTTINTVANTSITSTFSADMSTTFVEEMSDLAVVVFVQPTTLDAVLQSAYSVFTTLSNATNQKTATVRLFPNPSTGIVSLLSNEVTDVILIDIVGKTVFSKKGLHNNDQLDLTSLPKGVYIVKLQSEAGAINQKLVIN